MKKVKDFFGGLVVLIVIGLVWLILLAIWAWLPEGSLASEIGGAAFLLYSIAIIVVIVWAGLKGGHLESLVLLLIAGILCFFLVHLWKGLLVVLLFAGIGIAIWIGIGKWKERKKPIVLELEDHQAILSNIMYRKFKDYLKELREQLASGTITHEEYEQKREKIQEEYEQKKKKLLEKCKS